MLDSEDLGGEAAIREPERAHAAERARGKRRLLERTRAWGGMGRLQGFRPGNLLRARPLDGHNPRCGSRCRLEVCGGDPWVLFLDDNPDKVEGWCVRNGGESVSEEKVRTGRARRTY